VNGLTILACIVLVCAGILLAATLDTAHARKPRP